ncbi:hypothetical protein HGRIS_006523 [Hohenbuehelia grisea]|uniref:Uncharacterized protein n=1 Tax=Hohenbuehelia grisea TaxID=104357 RepID=A0ABR3J966_9AGAR
MEHSSYILVHATIPPTTAMFEYQPPTHSDIALATGRRFAGASLLSLRAGLWQRQSSSTRTMARSMVSSNSSSMCYRATYARGQGSIAAEKKARVVQGCGDPERLCARQSRVSVE